MVGNIFRKFYEIILKITEEKSQVSYLQISTIQFSIWQIYERKLEYVFTNRLVLETATQHLSKAD